MAFRRIIREYFSFSKGERIGLTILIMMMVILLVADRLIFYFERPSEADRKEFEKLLTMLEDQQGEKKGSQTLFPFNPNTIGEAGLCSLALPGQVKQNLLKYRSKGGVFRKKEDLRRLYGMNDSLYTILSPYVLAVVQDKPHSQTDMFEPPVEEGAAAMVVVRDNSQASRMEINNATAGDLCSLNGIGTVLSERIVRYRDLLGGFYSLGQLQEVYGLRAETLISIAGQLDLDTAGLARININFASPAELARHPYLDWKDAYRIIRYREAHGFIGHTGLLLQDSVIPASVFGKVAPYLRTSGN